MIDLLLGTFVGELLVAPFYDRADRRRLARGRVRSGIRAVNGRVHGMGTEWSTGECELSAGRIVFRPTVGIVGDRDIDALAVHGVHLGAMERPTLGPRGAAIHVVTTSAGDLYWAVPEAVAASARELVGAPIRRRVGEAG